VIVVDCVGRIAEELVHVFREAVADGTLKVAGVLVVWSTWFATVYQALRGGCIVRQNLVQGNRCDHFVTKWLVVLLAISSLVRLASCKILRAVFDS
jgi:hypothetical protein